MKVARMIEELQKCNPNAEVKMHHPTGYNALFVLRIKGDENTVFIEDKSDNDMAEELDARFNYASDNNLDELDFFMDLLEIGITLEDIKEFAPHKYDYCFNFMKEHGLI